MKKEEPDILVSMEISSEDILCIREGIWKRVRIYDAEGSLTTAISVNVTDRSYLEWAWGESSMPLQHFDHVMIDYDWDEQIDPYHGYLATRYPWVLLIRTWRPSYSYLETHTWTQKERRLSEISEEARRDPVWEREQ